MKESIYKSYEELPLFLNSRMVADILGISVSGAYELMYRKDFPVLTVGSCMVVSKDRFRNWVEEHTEGRV